MITWADVIAIAPELASVPVDTQNAILLDISKQLSASRWGERYDTACKYLAAHLGTISTLGGQGASGQVIGESS